jgi:histone deacetylase 1/2
MLIKFSDRLNITGYSDANWASSPDDRRPVGDYCVYFGDTLVAWSSKKQGSVSRSSTKSEYRALAHVAAEISWVQSLLDELGFHLLTTPITWCDNMSVKAMASNPVYHARTKHIELDVHYVQDRVLQNKLRVMYVPSSDQVADCLTKSLGSAAFQQFRYKLGVVQYPALSLEGYVVLYITVIISAVVTTVTSHSC